ncbi:ferrous iron transport protein A [Terasakiella sp. SH-1]|uniref:FeoA family protein n=1 Tax=Terasakiella sp. SH-1 TaxID=2560057 RepID=UPI001073012E|nr:ferrous iron transport protein A [Terasakiella sp. SH-1]
MATLANLGKGQRAYINQIGGDSTLKRKLLSMGIVKGVEVSLSHTAPLGDPRIYSLLGYDLSLRNDEAANITVDSTKP